MRRLFRKLLESFVLRDCTLDVTGEELSSIGLSDDHAGYLNVSLL